MTTKLSQAETVKPRNWLQRFLRIHYPQRAALALRNSLASSGPAGLDPSQVSSIMRLYGVSGSTVRRVLIDVWSESLTSFLKDGLLSADEMGHLDQLAKALGLSENELLQARHDVTAPIFVKAAEAAVDDGQLTEAEKEELSSLAERLQLPQSEAKELYGAAAAAKLEALTNQILADERVSPEEEQMLHSAAASLGVPIPANDTTRADLQRYALFWRVENADIPVIAVPIVLQRGECAYWAGQADWNELRTRTTRIDYAGPTASIRIAKGVRYRVGSITPRRITQEVLTRIDSGQLYITNKRVIFDGAKKNTAIRHSALLGFSVFSDGLVLEKATGRSPHLVISGDLELAAIILSAVLASQ